jgi:hypothetical protein
VEIDARPGSTVRQMGMQDRKEAAHFAELERLLKEYRELLEEPDVAEEERADREFDALLAELREVELRLAS